MVINLVRNVSCLYNKVYCYIKKKQRVFQMAVFALKKKLLKNLNIAIILVSVNNKFF